MVTFAIAIYLIGNQSLFRTPPVQVLEKIITMDADIIVNAVIQNLNLKTFKCHRAGPATQIPTPL